jgi:starch-binding outer membrane protein, SusD/RagB family
MMNIKFKNKICQVLALVTFLGFSYSCSDKFYTEPAGSQITPDQHFKSWIDLETAILGASVPLQKALPNLIVVDGLRSDLMDAGGGANMYLRDLYNQEISSDNPYLDGSPYYQVIIQVNEILNNIDRVGAREPNFDSFTKFSYIGNLIAFRSWAYLELVRLYNKAALISDNLPKMPADKNQVFLSKDVMLDTLINQLKPYIYSLSSDRSELNLSSYLPDTKAVLGEIYLEKNMYDSAVVYLKRACESYGNSPKQFKVDNDKVSGFVGASWIKIFQGSFTSSAENLFELPFDRNQRQFNPLCDLTALNTSYSAIPLLPSSVIVNLFNSQIESDFTVGDLFRGIGATIDTVPGNPSEYTINKYLLTEYYSEGIIVKRAADIHLMLAEAYNRMGQPALALTFVNDGFNGQGVTPGFEKWANNVGIRGRAGLVNLELDPTTASVETVEDAIMQEREMELAFEGHRWFDLVRVAKRRGDPDYLASRVAAKYADPAKAAAVRAKLQNEANWYLPIK